MIVQMTRLEPAKPPVSIPPNRHDHVPANDWGWWTPARKIVLGIVGGIVLLAGILMLVLPGPGVLVSLAGLGILAAEFPWAQRLLHNLRLRFRALLRRIKRRKNSSNAV